jgi:hypothetical protein
MKYIVILKIACPSITLIWITWYLGYFGGRVKQEINYDDVKTRVWLNGRIVESWYDYDKKRPLDSLANARFVQGEFILKLMK